DLGEPAPGEPDPEAVDGLKRVEAAAFEPFAPAELLEHLRRHPWVGARGEVVDEAFDGAADADEGQRLSGLVLDEVQIGIFLAYLVQDRLGELRGLGPGDRLEAVELRPGDLLPGGARHGAA